MISVNNKADNNEEQQCNNDKFYDFTRKMRSFQCLSPYEEAVSPGFLVDTASDVFAVAPVQLVGLV